MDPTYTIGRLARLAGVPASTIRYYERAGLLRARERTAGNYRLFGPADLQRLRFILAAKANGFTLEDVSALLDFRDGLIAPCRDVQSLIEERLAELETRLGQLHHVQEVLHASLDECRRSEASGRCQVIDTLTVTSSDDPEATGSEQENRSE